MGLSVNKVTAVLPDFGKFSEFVLQNQRQITPKIFSQEFGKVQKGFIAAKQRELFCKEADDLAAKLVAEKNGDFAGIIYSALTKLTEYFPKELEIYAKKGLAVAEANGDYVHMMARLNNLRKVYIDKPDKLYDYIQTLYAQEKCLKKLSKNFDDATAGFRTVSRKTATKEDYQKMLAYVQTEIGKLTWKKHPKDATKKLFSARQIFEARGDTQSVDYIDMLLSKVNKSSNLDKMA